jgi:hypothetical protein
MKRKKKALSKGREKSLRQRSMAMKLSGHHGVSGVKYGSTRWFNPRRRRRVIYRSRHSNRKRSKRFIQAAIKRPGALTATLRRWKILSGKKKVGELTAGQLDRAYTRAKKMSRSKQRATRQMGTRTMRQINFYRRVLKPTAKRKSMKATRRRTGFVVSRRKAANPRRRNGRLINELDQLIEKYADPNLKGFAARIPESKFFRSPPRGQSLDRPTDSEIRAKIFFAKKTHEKASRNPESENETIQGLKKTLDELTTKMSAIESKPENQMPPGSFYRFTPSARKKRDKIAWEITNTLAALRKARGEPINTEGYSGRQTKRRNPDVRLHWTQRGHTVYSPTGRGLYNMKAWWRTGLKKPKDVREAVKKAHKYALKQKDWTKHRVTVEGNPSRKFKLGEKIIFTGGGVDDGRTGVVVPMRMIQIGDRGVPKVPGAYKPIGKDDIAVKYDDGGLDVVKKSWISKAKARNPIYHYKHRYDSKHPWQRSEVFAGDYDTAVDRMMKAHPDMQIDLEEIQDIDDRAYARLGRSPTWEGLGPRRKHHRKVWRPARSRKR